MLYWTIFDGDYTVTGPKVLLWAALATPQLVVWAGAARVIR